MDMTMSSDEDDEVKLYNPLARNQKRKIFVTLSSSSESEDNDTLDVSISSIDSEEPSAQHRRRRRKRKDSSIVSHTKVPPTDVIEDQDEVQVLSAEEIAATKLREAQIQQEIVARLAQDAILNQTRAIMERINASHQHGAHARREVVILDSDEDDEFPVLQGAPVKPTAPSANTKGERITLRVRSNGTTVDEIVMHMNESFDLLYQRFCEAQGVPRAAVQLKLDGEALTIQSTPACEDLSSGDIIDATVDFSQQNDAKKRRLIRLKIVVQGKRPEVFRIDATATLEKLRDSYCKKHGLSHDAVLRLEADDHTLDLKETIASSGFLDGDEISIIRTEQSDARTIELQFRFPNGHIEIMQTNPRSPIEEMISTLAQSRQLRASQLSIWIDGEIMNPTHPFQFYDLEGGELIDVKVKDLAP